MMMEREDVELTCGACGAATQEAAVEETRTVGVRRFVAAVPARRCAACGETYVGQAAGVAFDAAVTRHLVEDGDDTPAALRWLRKAAGLRATELAALLGVRPETISRWEHGAALPDRAVIYTLGTLALARVHGQQESAARLRALAQPAPRPDVVRLHLAA
jgi:putative zinc finger/helix-turn-helix YgiT family protein